jgi:hypothetical protein
VGEKKGHLTLKDSIKHNETRVGYDQPTADTVILIII